MSKINFSMMNYKLFLSSLTTHARLNAVCPLCAPLYSQRARQDFYAAFC